MSRERVHFAWVVVSPAEDVPGEWLAHCLDLDIMSQGKSVDHALAMMLEAVNLVLDEDCKAKVNPLDRRAPEAAWHELSLRMRNAELSSIDEIRREADKGTLTWMATQLGIHFVVDHKKPRVETKAQAIVQYACAAA